MVAEQSPEPRKQEIRVNEKENISQNSSSQVIQKQSDNERPASGMRDLIKGSSQSQRIKSASKKGSESEDFNFDLTVKTKNSKNGFKVSLGKQDSLMYSAQSDFGMKPLSPLKGN